MSDEISSGSSGSSSVAEATPGTSGGSEQSSESLVTPELQAKFDQVFGGKESAADREAGKGPTRQPKQPQPQAKKQQKHYFDGDDDTGDDDAAPVPQPKQQQKPLKQPASPQPQNSTASRSRVSNQPSGDQSGDPTQQQQGDEQGDDTPTLNPILKRAALRAKWDPDVVQQFWERDPDLAEKTFAQLHRSQNELSSRFAQLGQQPQQQAMPQTYQQPRGQSVNPAPAPQVPSNPNDIMQMMAEVYGGQQSFEKLNADWNNAIPTLIQPFVERVLMPQQQMLQQAMNFIAGQERQNVAKEATMWFNGVKDDFGEMYGIGTTTPSQEQMQAKRALTLTADRIRNGARTQGIQMTVSEALEQAHLMIAADHYQEVERKRITAQIKRRSASITARPTQRRSPAVSGTGGDTVKSLEAAQEAYAAKAAELGIDL